MDITSHYLHSPRECFAVTMNALSVHRPWLSSNAEYSATMKLKSWTSFVATLNYAFFSLSSVMECNFFILASPVNHLLSNLILNWITSTSMCLPIQRKPCSPMWQTYTANNSHFYITSYRSSCFQIPICHVLSDLHCTPCLKYLKVIDMLLFFSVF